MKKIIFYCYDMKIGGIQKSLCNLINNIHELYNITLFLCNKTGKLLESIPKDVNVITFKKHKYEMLYKSLREAKKEGFKYYIYKIFFSLLCKIFGNFVVTKFLIRNYRLEREYDTAISFAHNANKRSLIFGCNYMCLKTKAKKHYAFVHGDFEKIRLNTKKQIAEYKKFDKIISVSESLRKITAKYFCDSKTLAICNTHLIDQIKVKTENRIQKNSRFVSFCTVCRLSEEKGLRRVLDCCKELEISKIPYIWYLVGDGPLLSTCENFIKKNHINNLKILKETTNPYPIINESTYLVIASYHEAAPMVIDEAHILNKPVISTNFISAEEMINKELICENNTQSFITKILELAKQYNFKHEITKDKIYTEIQNNERIKAFEEIV